MFKRLLGGLMDSPQQDPVVPPGTPQGLPYFMLSPPAPATQRDLERQKSNPSAATQTTLSTPPPPVAAAPVFGVLLEEILARPEEAGHEIPAFVECIFRYLQQRALRAEGIFRISGDSVRIQMLKTNFDNGNYHQILSDWKDYHSVAGLLKMFLRELPEPIFPFELYDSFISSQMRPEPSQQLAGIWELLKGFPVAHKRMLRRLIEFLLEVVKYSDENKMTTSSLAIVFAPNLLRPKSANTFQFINDARFINSIVRSILEQYELLADALVDQPGEGESIDGLVPPQPPKRRLWRKQAHGAPEASTATSTDTEEEHSSAPLDSEISSIARQDEAASSADPGTKKRTNSDSEVTKRMSPPIAPLPLNSTAGADTTSNDLSEAAAQARMSLKRSSGSAAEGWMKMGDVTASGAPGDSTKSARELRWQKERPEVRWETVQPLASELPLGSTRTRGELIGKKGSTATDSSLATSPPTSASTAPSSPMPSIPSPPNFPVSKQPSPTTTESKPTSTTTPSVPAVSTSPVNIASEPVSTVPTPATPSSVAQPSSNSGPAPEEVVEPSYPEEMLSKPLEFLCSKLEQHRSIHARSNSIKAMNALQLTEEKNFLKRILREYNIAFEKEKGRSPTIEDKEPLRPLYRQYQLIKKRLKNLENPSNVENEESGPSRISRDRELRTTRSISELKEEQAGILRKLEELEKQPQQKDEEIRLERIRLDRKSVV